MAAIVAAYFVEELVVPWRAYALIALVNAQMILLPTVAVMAIVRGLSWRERLAIQLFTVYMGSVDIYYGAFRTGRALIKMATGSNRWNTYKSFGHGPFRTMIAYVGHIKVELMVAALLAAAVAYDGAEGAFGTRQIIALTYLVLILTFPAYAYASSKKRGKFDVTERKANITAVSSTNSIRSTKETETEDVMLEVALGEILASIRMERLDDIQADVQAQAKALEDVKAQAYARAFELELITEDPPVVVDCEAFEGEDLWVPGPNGMQRFVAAGINTI